MAENAPPPEGPAPDFGARRVLFAGTGSLGVMFMPMWLNWLRTAYPDIEVRTMLTRSAQRFVTRDALTAFAGGTVLQDVWPDEPEEGATHVELAQWPDAIVVHPATYNFVGRLALGAADTPLLLALQCTRAPVAVAPALPPGGAESYGYRRHVAALAERPNVTVVPPQPGYSVTTGRPGATVATPLPAVIPALERLRARLAAAPSPGEEEGR
ncbi:flavoprotein [Streptomyces sp. NBC_01003]|uniref:flavoprotein n=1 Tax=Streptomyces sp. NBC_01003 TaxID=2903714 RepID=UPI003866538B|nr:flavoprotein [Streptomyces sp. NBC_01003]